MCTTVAQRLPYLLSSTNDLLTWFTGMFHIVLHHSILLWVNDECACAKSPMFAPVVANFVFHFFQEVVYVAIRGMYFLPSRLFLSGSFHPVKTTRSIGVLWVFTSKLRGNDGFHNSHSLIVIHSIDDHVQCSLSVIQP